MRFQRIIEQVYGRPWLITSQGWDSVHRLISERLTAQELRPSAERPEEDFFGDPLPVMRIDGATAIIPVEGVIGRKLGMLEKSCGSVDTMDISEDLKSALANPNVRNIVLDVNSPGGTVSGVPELADEIKAANKQKPVTAFANDLMASAAYWISAGASRVVATPSSAVGSIGVFVPWIDQSEAYKQRGLEVDVIKAGKFKAMGYPGTSLSDEQRQHLQDGVNETFTEFTSFITANRKRVNSEAMQGQVFSGRAAAGMGLVTGIVSGMDELLASLR